MRKIIYILLIFTVLFSANLFSHNSNQIELYQAFITRDIAKWEKATMNFEKTVDFDKTDDLLNLIHYYYGWTSELLDNKQYKKAEANIVKVERWLDKILEKNPNNAVATNYKGVFISYRLSYDKSKLVSMGKQSLHLIKKAYTLNPNNIQVLFDNGNAYYYPPKVLGGDKKKALMYYQKAISIIEKQNNTNKNWMYVQMLMLEARCNELIGNNEEAKKGYEKTLKVEPNFKIVKDKFYPELLKKMS